MDNKEVNEMVFEDISSSSPDNAVKKVQKTVKAAKKAADDYGDSSHKNIDKVIKFIEYLVAISLFIVFLVAAGVVFYLDKMLIFLSALILVLGGAVSLMILNLIYGLGYIISQNKEILRRLGK